MLDGSHRRAVTVVFCDLRGFTAFSEISEPEEVMSVLREYHTALGVLVDKFEGTVERFTGDGLLVIFNDPMECTPIRRCARWEWRSKCAARSPELSAKWSRSGVPYRLRHRHCARLCDARHDRICGAPAVFGDGQGGEPRLRTLRDEAKNGQILIDINVFSAIETQSRNRHRGGTDPQGLQPACESVQCAQSQSVRPDLPMRSDP